MGEDKQKKSRMRAFDGASPILNPAHLLSSQRSTLKRIAMRIRQLACAEAARELTFKDKGTNWQELYQRKQRYRRPHQVFLIDGARGSGKTTLLLTMQEYLKLLGRPAKWQSSENNPETIAYELNEAAEKINDDLAKARQEPRQDVFSFKPKHDLGSCERQTVWYLDVIFPTELEANQSILEGVLATMVDTLKKEITKSSKANEPDSESRSRRAEHRDPERDASVREPGTRDPKWAEALIKKANEKVAKGWFLSKNEGRDAILQDSIDYKDFLKKKSDANVASFGRINIWRDFVNEYLNFFGAELLAVFFDDTDVDPESTRDILHTIRIFLDHPRIVTIIAGNLRSMRQDMLLHEMGELRSPIGSLTGEAETTASDWRLFVRHQIEESLEKVMPRPLRHYIKAKLDPPDIPREHDRGTETCGDRSDFHLVFGMGLDRLCGEALDGKRDEFLLNRHRAHFRQMLDRRQIESDSEMESLEGFVSWWMFRHWYAEELRPRAARHLTALKAFVLTLKKDDTDFVIDELPSEHRKRLAVVLFEAPENHALAHRLGDGDSRVWLWLHRQSIKSRWRDDRYFEINERRIYERTYSYDFLRYRLDLGIGMPIKENPDESIPLGLLPVPSGPNLIGYRPFFPKMLRQRYYGIGNGLKHSVIPANCIYFNDASALPNVAWAESTDGSDLKTWGAQIVYNWPDLFFFDTDELRAKREKDTVLVKEGNMSADVPEGWIRDYFVNVVLPFSSADFGRYARTPNNCTDAPDWEKIAKAMDHALMRAELPGSTELKPGIEPMGPFFKRVRDKMEPIRRRLDFISAATDTFIDGVGNLQAATDTRRSWSKEVLDKVVPEGGGEDLSALRAHLSDYQWLVNDARRAWHAGRIFLNQRASTLSKASHKERPVQASKGEVAGGGSGWDDTPEMTGKNAFSRADIYTVPTSATFARWLDHSATFSDFMNAYRQPSLGLEDCGIRRNGDFFIADPALRLRRMVRDVSLLVDPSREPPPDEPPANRSLDLEFVEPERVMRFLKARKQDWPESCGPWLLFLDPATTDKRKPAPSPASLLLARTHARLARDFLFFLYGVTPTLPSLIHIEVASAIFHSVKPGNPSGRNPKNDAVAILHAWNLRVIDFLRFVQNYRRVLEVAKLRMDIFTLLDGPPFPNSNENGSNKNDVKRAPAFGELERSASGFGVCLALTPDVDFETLGAQGVGYFLEREGRQPLGTLNFSGDGSGRPPSPAEKDDFDELRNRWLAFSVEVKSHNQRIAWRSMIDTVIENLVETFNFIEVTMRIINEGL